MRVDGCSLKLLSSSILAIEPYYFWAFIYYEMITFSVFECARHHLYLRTVDSICNYAFQSNIRPLPDIDSLRINKDIHISDCALIN